MGRKPPQISAIDRNTDPEDDLDHHGISGLHICSWCDNPKPKGADPELEIWLGRTLFLVFGLVAVIVSVAYLFFNAN